MSTGEQRDPRTPRPFDVRVTPGHLFRLVVLPSPCVCGSSAAALATARCCAPSMRLCSPSAWRASSAPRVTHVARHGITRGCAYPFCLRRPFGHRGADVSSQPLRRWRGRCWANLFAPNIYAERGPCWSSRRSCTRCLPSSGARCARGGRSPPSASSRAAPRREPQAHVRTWAAAHRTAGARRGRGAWCESTWSNLDVRSTS
jgi:hypothetical protein